MEENELDAIDEQEPIDEAGEEPTGDSPENYKEFWEKKVNTLEAQKEHWRKKATQPKPEEKKEAEINKPNEPTIGLTREEAILIAKGVPDEIINQASLVAKAKGVSLSEAMKDPLIEAYSEKIIAEEKKGKAQLGPATSGPTYKGVPLEQAVGMSEEEHRKAIGM